MDGIATVMPKLPMMWPGAVSCQTAPATVASSGAVHLQVMVMSPGPLYGTCVSFCLDSASGCLLVGPENTPDTPLAARSQQ